MVELLLRYFPLIDFQDSMGFTPLYYALKANNWKIVIVKNFNLSYY